MINIEAETVQFQRLSQYSAEVRGLSGADMFIPVSTFANRPVPDRPWLIDRMIPSETVTMHQGQAT